MHAPDPEVRVRLKADGRAEAAHVVAVMELLREAGVERVKLLITITDITTLLTLSARGLVRRGSRPPTLPVEPVDMLYYNAS